MTNSNDSTESSSSKTTVLIERKRFEIGAQFTSLMRNGDGDRFVGFSAVGIGSRRDGRVLQGFFGAKVGRKFEKFGVFAKARPGFVQYSRGKQSIDGTLSDVRFTTGAETNPALDVGGVLEFYPTKRITTRFDVGDTIVRFGKQNTTGFDFFNQQLFPVVLPSETKHNFQFGAGIGFRF